MNVGMSLSATAVSVEFNELCTHFPQMKDAETYIREAHTHQVRAEKLIKESQGCRGKEAYKVEEASEALEQAARLLKLAKSCAPSVQCVNSPIVPLTIFVRLRGGRLS